MVIVFLLICIQFVSVDMTLIGNAFRTRSSIISSPACLCYVGEPLWYDWNQV